MVADLESFSEHKAVVLMTCVCNQWFSSIAGFQPFRTETFGAAVWLALDTAYLLHTECTGFILKYIELQKDDLAPYQNVATFF